jgi:uncharacterized caspase-like protein
MKHKHLLLTLIICIFSSSITFAQTTHRNIYALIVGVSEYSTPENNLQFPAKDATQMYDLLKGRTSPEKIVLLTNEKATHDNILSSAEQLFSTTTVNDVIVLYFSGHGHQGGFVSHDKSIYYSEIKKIFQTVEARKIIFADACFSGKIREDDPNINGVETEMSNQRVCLFLSSRSEQISLESTGIDNGFFTYYLLAGLRGGADVDKNRIITALELFEFVNPRVKEQSGGLQVPVMWGRFEDNMAILNWNK